MVYYSINDIYRKRMYENNEKQIMSFMDSLEDADKERCLHILVSDGYQILCKRKNNLEDNLSKILLSILQKSQFSRIKYVLEDNYRLFQVLFVNAKGFWTLPIIDRCILIGENYDYEQHRKLLLLDPLYLTDVCGYSIQKDINSINYYHQDYLKKMGIIGATSFYNLVVTIMRQLKNEDENTYSYNFLEIMKGFYINYKFLSEIDEQLVNDSKNYCQEIEKQDLEIIENSLIHHPNDFAYVIGQYFVYKNDLEGREEVKEFIDNNISSDMIKKLKITI